MSRRERIIALSSEIADLRAAAARREEELDRLLADEAPEPASVSTVKALPANGHQRRGAYSCGSCGAVGHTRRSCPTVAAPAPAAPVAEAEPVAVGTGKALRCYLTAIGGGAACGATVFESEITPHVRNVHGMLMNIRAAREYFR